MRKESESIALCIYAHLRSRIIAHVRIKPIKNHWAKTTIAPDASVPVTTIAIKAGMLIICQMKRDHPGYNES